MKIALLSDLHMELGSEMPGPIEGVDVYILAGDINSGGANKVARYVFFDSCLSGEETLYIPGNHEYYGSKAPDPLAKGGRDGYDIEDTSFIGVTLWSDPDPNYTRFLNDFPMIEGMSPDLMRQLHQRDKQYLFDTIDAAVHDGVEKIVVFTHHLPSLECVLPKYRDSYLNSFFVSNTLEEIWQPEWAGKVVAWLYGHTHDKMDFMHSLGVRMVSNPHGYQGYETFRKAQWKVIEV